MLSLNERPVRTEMQKQRSDTFKNLWNQKSSNEKEITTKKDNYPELPEAGRDATLLLRVNLDGYLKEIETITGKKIGVEQRKLLNQYIATGNFVKMNDKQKAKHRTEFNKRRVDLRQEWETMTGQEWPKYKENIYLNGKIARRAGGCFDAHHIVENSYGGKHEWWNLHPAAYPNEHQDGLHDNNSIGTKIFGPIKKEFHAYPTDKKNCYVSRRSLS